MVLAVAVVGWIEFRRRSAEPDGTVGRSPGEATLSGRLLSREGGEPSEGALVLVVDGTGSRVLDAALSTRDGAFEVLRFPGLVPPPSLWVLFPDGEALHRPTLPATASFADPLFPTRAPVTVLYRTAGLQNRLWEIHRSSVRLALPALPHGLRDIPAPSPSTGVLRVPMGVPLDVRLWLSEDDYTAFAANLTVPATGHLLDGLLPPLAMAGGRLSHPKTVGDARRILVFAPKAPEGTMVQATRTTLHFGAGGRGTSEKQISMPLRSGIALFDQQEAGTWTITLDSTQSVEVDLTEPGLHLVKFR
jgi:hypothetical protein